MLSSKPCKRNGAPPSLSELLPLLVTDFQGLRPSVLRSSSDLPLLELVIVELLLVGDLLLGRWRQQLELPLLGLSQQLLSGDLNLGRSLVLHLQDR